MELLVVVVMFAALALVSRAGLDAPVARRALPVLLVALAVRLIVHVLLQRGTLIDYGGDNLGYEHLALEIAEQWKREGVSYIDANRAGQLYSVAVPCNLLALVIYFCGGPAPLACTALVGLLACVLCVVMYRFARTIGADDRASFRLLVVMAFIPAFLIHTSDTYKDGFNALFVVTSLALGVSLTRRFTITKVLMLIPLLWALWNVRAYMVFMCLLPLALGVAGPKRVFSLGSMVVITVSLISAVFMSGAIVRSEPVETMLELLEGGQSDNVRFSNARGGSGVLFDDGGEAWNAIGAKLLYTIFSPFPWTPGSLALQLGKIDTLVWYVLLIYAFAGARRLWRCDRRVLLILLLFILPSTVAYATSMANIGLMFRQRMPLVMVTSLMSAVAWTRTPRDRSDPMTAGPGQGTEEVTPSVAVR